jgi:hypothetical protein
LKAGTSIPLDKIANVVNNNPHSFGLILRDPKAKKLEIIKRCHKEGNSPEEIHDLLEDNKDLERYLHVRWRTEGPIDLENAHPFTAYMSNSRQVEFMHNGTLADFRPKTQDVWENNVRKTTTLENISDSKKFNDEFLAPLLLTITGENGRGDIGNVMFQRIVEKFWGHSSRGVLICNDLDPVLINAKDWKELDFGGGKFWSSNTEYWEKLTRGPVYEAEKKKKDEEEAKERNRFQGSESDRRGVTNLKDVNLKAKDILPESLSNVFEDYNIWTEDGTASLCNLTEIEVQDFVKRDNDAAASLIIHLTSYYDEIYKRKLRMVKYIKELKKDGKTTFEKEDEKELI